MQHNTGARTIRTIATVGFVALLVALFATGSSPTARAQTPRHVYLPMLALNAGGEAAQPTPSSTTEPTAQPTATPPTRTEGQQADLAAEVLRLVNIERVTAGCGVLEPQDQLRIAAEGHSADQAIRNYYSHFEPVTRNSQKDRAQAAGYQGRIVGENLVVGSDDATVLVQVWMNSTGHRITMLDCDYRYGAVGVYYQPDDQPNVQAVDFFSGELVPFGADGYSTDPLDGSMKIRGPYYYYTTLVLGEEPALAQSEDISPSAAMPTPTR